MKLRRAMATAAATAVIAPLALLSAPAAFATPDPSASATPSPSASAPESPSPSAAPSTPTPSASTSATPSPSAPAPSPSVSTPASPSPSVPATPTPSPSASQPTDPEEPAPYCEELDENFDGARVSAAISGLPGKIVAGSGFHTFTLKVTNDSKVDVEGVAFYAEVENYEVEDESKYLSRFVDLEFKNPESGKWERIGSDDWAGDYFFYAEKLGAGKSQQVQLRLSIDADAPAGDAYSFGSGAYLDNVDGQDCIAEGWAAYDFEVLKPGSANPDPGEAKPGTGGGQGDGDGKGGNKPKPSGDVSELPGGSLAETGSSSMLPTIGLLGGLAVVAGAGAVFVVRRRKGDATA